jgi:DNA-binding NarL/FixJ family response regulator
MTIRVLLVDDQPLLRQGFAMILGARDDIEVVGEAAEGKEAVRLASLLRPDVVLMDVRMPGFDGIEATQRITALGTGVRILILTTFDLDQYAFDGLRAGASGFLLKNVRPDELVAGIRAVAGGDAVLAPSTTRRLVDTYGEHFGRAPGPVIAPGDGALEELTSRERDVFTEMATGCSNREIAEHLFLSETTVKTHVVRILAKLDLRDRVHAVIFAYENGLARPFPGPPDGSGEAGPEG